mgnify:FL=1
MKKAIAILFLCLFSGIVSAQTLWGGFMIDIKNAAGDTVSTTNLQAVKSFVGAGGGATDLTFTGASSPYTLASSTGTDVTISAGTNVTLTRTGNDLEIASSGGSGAVATDAIWDAKGDLAVGTGANTASRLAVGTDGKQIYADAAESTGLRWGHSIISPSQITSDQDNYAPTGWAKAQIVRIDADDFRAITSFSATFSGDTKTISNVGSFPVYFPGQHPDGTAANRIKTRRDYILFPGESVDIWYDGTASRWEIKGHQPPTIYEKGSAGYFSVGSATNSAWPNLTITNSGSGAATTAEVAESGIPGHWLFTTGTTATGANTFTTKGTNEPFYFGDAHLAVESVLLLPTLSDGTQTYYVHVGIDAVPGTNPTTGLPNNNSIGIRYNDGVNSGKWEGYSRDNAGTETTVDLGITVAAATNYKLRVELDKSRTEARFYIDDSMLGVVAANMPTAQSCGPKVRLSKTAGTTGRLMRVSTFAYQSIYP